MLYYRLVGKNPTKTRVLVDRNLRNFVPLGATENARLELSAPNCRGWKMRAKELWNAKAPCCSGSQKIICPIICWKYQCCNCVFQQAYYDSVSDRLEPYGYEMCVNLISFYVQCYGLQSVKRNTRNTQTYMAHAVKHVQ